MMAFGDKDYFANLAKTASTETLVETIRFGKKRLYEGAHDPDYIQAGVDAATEELARRKV